MWQRPMAYCIEHRDSTYHAARDSATCRLNRRRPDHSERENKRQRLIYRKEERRGRPVHRAQRATWDKVTNRWMDTSVTDFPERRHTRRSSI